MRKHCRQESESPVPRPVPVQWSAAVFVLRKSFFHRFLLFHPALSVSTSPLLPPARSAGLSTVRSLSHLFYATEDYFGWFPGTELLSVEPHQSSHADAGKYKLSHPDRLQ